MKRIFFRRLTGLAVAAAVCLSLAACQRQTEVKTQIFAMDTVMSITLYGTDQKACEEALNQAVDRIYALEALLSVTRTGSEIYAVNHAGGEWTRLSPDTAALLEGALALCDLTGGALDVTAYPAVRAWGFTTGEHRIPSSAELAQLAARIDYTQVEQNEDNSSVRLPQDMELDLGSVAKGYVGDCLVQLLESFDGVDGALLDLGQSTIQALGPRSDGTPWRIGIQDPAGEGYLGVLALSGKAMGTSGGYQRYFEENGVRYWHILDPATAAPARAGLAAVAVAGPSGLVCDGLSTALFVMGLNQASSLMSELSRSGYEAIFLMDDGSVTLTPGMESSFTLAKGYEDREVTVLP